MMAGMQSTAGTMFPGLGGIGNAGPSVEDMEKARQRVLCHKTVECNAYHVRIFDMHDAKEVKAYEKQMLGLMSGIQAGTCVVWANERQLLTRDGKQGWFRYIEWSEHLLHEEPTPVIGAGE